ncbi:MAG: hypothetical protein ACOX5J_16610 [Candidatus Hydrogenedentales bacterium]|jgi:hypothetical protein
MKLGRLGILCALLCVVGAACQTTRSAPPDVEAPLLSAPRGYQPMSYLSTIQMNEGEYPDLFSAESSAVWVDNDVTEMKYARERETGKAPPTGLVAAARAVNRDFFVFECHIESLFRDMSIAYDVVGFRGIDVHLETPDGKQIEPIQIIIGTPVEEEQRGTLKQFRRINIAVFPRTDLWTGGDTVAVGSGAVRLVLSGHGSTFCFEWPELPQASTDAGPSWNPSENEMLQAVKVSFSDLYGRLRRLAHTFD